MNLKQQRFVDYFIESGNAALAYRKAGYEAKTRDAADVSASQIVRNLQVSSEIARRRKEIADAGAIRIESKRVMLWDIANKASGKIRPENENEEFVPDYKAAIAAINELNRMDGHHQDKKIRITDDRFTFDAEILPPESETESENAEFIQLDAPEKNDK